VGGEEELDAFDQLKFWLMRSGRRRKVKDSQIGKRSRHSVGGSRKTGNASETLVLNL